MFAESEPEKGDILTIILPTLAGVIILAFGVAFAVKKYNSKKARSVYSTNFDSQNFYTF